MDASSKQTQNQKVAVVGGGLVGALEACVLATEGYEVHLYEYRNDIRKLKHVPGKSINLAMSVRGISALDRIGLGHHVANEYGIPMRARMIHNVDGSTYPVPYGKQGQCIFSVGRRYVNEILLTAGEKYENLHFHFEHKLISLDLDSATMTFEVNASEKMTVQADFVLGCDGAFSMVRKAFMRKPWFDFSQTYIPHAYKELCIPAVDGTHAMPPNFLHIWPRGQFMLIALPNQDKSFTVTLFMPTEKFTSITTDQDLISFFNTHFPDALALIGHQNLIDTFFSIEPGPLICIKCSQYHWSDKCLILGDAAHAIVPFYGQGMNCGMEDVLVLEDMLKKYPHDRKRAFKEYSIHRQPDAHAICDLAMYNYIEMRDLVTHPSFLIRKKLDSFLNWLLPSTWLPLYSTVTFSRMRYHQCILNKKWQDQVLAAVQKWISLAGLLGLTFWLAKKRSSLNSLLPGHIF